MISMDARAGVIVSLLTLVLLGVPVWWKTTEIYRADLPHDTIAFYSRWAAEELLLEPWEITVDLVVLSPSSKESPSETVIKSLGDEVRQKLNSAALQSGTSPLDSIVPGEYKYAFKVLAKGHTSEEIRNAGKLQGKELDEWLQSFGKSSEIGSKTANGHYVFYVLFGSEGAASIGQYRHGWHQVKDIASLQSSVATVAGNIANLCRTYLVPHYTQQDSKESMAARPATEYRLSFNLLNANPNERWVTWDFRTAARKYLDPFLKTIEPIARFTVDSQVLQYSSLSTTPPFDKQNSIYYIPSQSLSVYINPHEWKLDLADTSTQPILNFIAFIPDPNHSPLHIKSEDGGISTTNAFAIPQWGGIKILNLDNATRHLSIDKMENVMQSFIGQIRELLGVHMIKPSEVVPASQTGIALWERDAIFRRYLMYNTFSAVSTLQSMSSLVQNLTNMVVLDNIAQLTSTAVSSIAEVKEGLQRGAFDEALVASKDAVSTAEAAFFDPNMLSLLYFPDEHKLAIYALPFLPLFLQLLSGARAEWNIRKQEKKKKVD